MSYLHPVLRWIGGKWKNIDLFTIYIPSDVKERLYVEPFVGSGAMLFKIRPSRALINDINKEIINLYDVIKKFPLNLIYKLLWNDRHDCKQHYYVMRTEYNINKKESYLDNKEKIEQAARFIYLNARCFNGLYRENSSGDMNAPYAEGLKGMKHVCNKKNIFAMSNYFNSMLELKFLNLSYEHILSYIEEMAKDSKVFLFLDPPYYPLTSTASFTAYNKDFWKEDDFIKLKKFIDEINKRKWLFLLCNHSVPFIKDLFNEYNQVEHVVSRSISCKARDRKPALELLIFNYAINTTKQMKVI